MKKVTVLATLYLGAFLLLAFDAHASIPVVVNATVVLPTKDNQGAAFLVQFPLTKVQYFAATSPIPDTATTPIVETGAVTTASFTLPANVGDTIYVRARACNAFVCGALSPPGTKDVAGQVPGTMPAPVIITITLSVGP